MLFSSLVITLPLTKCSTKFLVVANITKSLLDGENNVEEEIADVEIMLTQLKIMYNLSDIENWRNYKLNRLKERVW